MNKLCLFVSFLFFVTVASASPTISKLQQEANNVLSKYEQTLLENKSKAEKLNDKYLQEEFLFYNNKKVLEEMINKSQPLIKKLKNFQKEKISDEEMIISDSIIDKFTDFEKMLDNAKSKDKEIQNINTKIDEMINFIESYNTYTNTKSFEEVILKLRYVKKNTELSDFKKYKYTKKIGNFVIQIGTIQDCTVGLKADKSVIVLKQYTDNIVFDFSSWTNVKQLTSFDNHILGLKEDGTVLMFGKNLQGECNVSDWTDIQSLHSSFEHTVGIKNNGTAVATGRNDFGQCNVSGWKNIKTALAGAEHTVGLKKDGTVVAIGRNDFGQCNVSNWKDISKISVGANHTIGLKEDGTVVATGDNEFGQCNVSGWNNLKKVIACDVYTLGLKKDGTVVATGRNDFGRCNVSDWKDIVYIETDVLTTYGIKSDGTTISTNPKKEIVNKLNSINNLDLD